MLAYTRLAVAGGASRRHTVMICGDERRHDERAFAARPVPVFLLPYAGARGLAQIWRTNSGVKAQPMLARRLQLAMSVLDEETPGSALVTLSVPAERTARNVGWTTTQRSGMKMMKSRSRASGRRCVLDLTLFNLPRGRSVPTRCRRTAPHGPLRRRCVWPRSSSGRCRAAAPRACGPADQ